MFMWSFGARMWLPWPLRAGAREPQTEAAAQPARAELPGGPKREAPRQPPPEMRLGSADHDHGFFL